MPCLALTCNPEPRHAALRSETLGGPHKSVLALGLVYYNYQKKIEEAADRASPMPHHASITTTATTTDASAEGVEVQSVEVKTA